jgi:uroporphyrinogen-III synthase
VTDVLVTRPEPGAGETARRVEALGLIPVLAPGLVLQPRPMAPVRGAQALLLTSRAAARAVPVMALPRALPGEPTVLAVGEATAAEARRRGWGHVVAAGGDAADLARCAASRYRPEAGALLLAVGQGYGAELAEALRSRGFRVLRRVVYAAQPAPSLPEPARRALGAGTIAAALFFSPRSAQAAVAMIDQAGLTEQTSEIAAFALSARVAAALAGGRWRSLRVASQPTQDHLLEELAKAVGP